MKNYGVNITPIDDTMLLSYCLSAGARRHNMDELSEAELGITTVKFSEVAGKGKTAITFDMVEIDKATNYAAEDADITLRLHQTLKSQLIEQKLTSVYERMERPLVPVIVEMEHCGIKVNPSKNYKDYHWNLRIKSPSLKKIYLS